MSARSRHQESFEGAHAQRFDARAGLPAAVARAVAAHVRSRCPGERLLEVGAGTGEIGAQLLKLAPTLRYVGCDLSSAMLQQFRARAAGEVALLRIDAQRAWPFSAASFDAVWMARVAHLFEPEALAAQLARVLRPGGHLLLGRSERPRDGVHALLRRELRARLRARGYEPRGGKQDVERLKTRAPWLTTVERCEVAVWDAKESAHAVLETWRHKPGLSGVDVTTADKHQLLSELEALAHVRLGADLTVQRPARERFVIEVLRSTK